MVERLPSEHKALGLVPSSEKKKKKKEEEEEEEEEGIGEIV